MSKQYLVDRQWADALYQLEQQQNKKPICGMISASKLPKMAREALVDLIERRFPPLKRGRPRPPAYAVSDKTDAQQAAMCDVYLLRQTGMPLKDALRKAAEDNDLSVNTVKLLRSGRHRSFRESQLNPGLKRKHKAQVKAS